MNNQRHLDILMKPPPADSLGSLIHGQSKALELSLRDAPLGDIMSVIIRTIEEHSAGEVIGSILLLDDERKRLRFGAGPSLSKEYNEAIDGIEIGPAVGSCGTAAFHGKPAFAQDIANEPAWSRFRELALREGLRACWSTPIFASDGTVLGTFAMYYKEPRTPHPADEHIVDLVTQTAALIIERKRQALANQQIVEALKTTSDDLAKQVETLTRLHELAVRLSKETTLQPALRAILDTLIECHGADFGVLSLCDPQTGNLVGEVSCGFDSRDQQVTLLNSEINAGACEHAFATKQRVMVIDTETDPRFESFKSFARSVGFRSVHCIPILTRNDHPLGVVSVHFRVPRVPTTREMQLADVCALHIADAIEGARAQDSVRESEERLRLALGSADSGVWDWNIAKGTVTWSEGLEAIHGLAPGTFEGTFDAFQSDIHPVDRERVLASIKRAVDQRSAHHIEYRLQLQNGDIRWVEARGAPISDRDGKVVRLVGICMDVTARKVAEEARARLQAVVESSADAIISESLDGTITTWNEGAARTFGYSADEAIGQPIIMLSPPAFVDQAAGLLDAARRGEKVRHFETVRRRKDGKLISVSVSISPVRGVNGEIVGLSKIARDISEEKQARDELRAAKEAADAANRAKSEFLANMSHEIRTPLGAIVGFSELMYNSEQTPSDRDECLTAIHRNGAHLLQLVNDILDLSKVESGKLELEYRKISLLDFLAEVRLLEKAHAKEKNITLEVTAQGPLPSEITIDDQRLRQILLNLLSNAIKFTERGSVTLAASYRPPIAEGGKATIEIKVKDTGCGMNAQQSQRLFQAFSQGDSSTTRKYGGTGLGLALSRKLARALGGDLVLEFSEPGYGSVFVLTIAVAPVDDARLIQPLDIERSPGLLRHDDNVDHNPLLGVRVLLVEDTPDNQRLVARILRSVGAELEFANDGEEGIKKALAGSFDIILMDVQMPILDGYEATVRLRREGYSVPIVALTAHAMASEREKCLRIGCNEHLTKPISRSRLIETVSKLVGMKAKSTDETEETLDIPDISDILTMFVEEILPQSLTDLNAALAIDDWGQVKALAHRLKGSAGYYLFHSLPTIAGSLEAEAKGARRKDIAMSLVAKLADLDSGDATSPFSQRASFLLAANSKREANKG